jgi:hypothetical protein
MIYLKLSSGEEVTFHPDTEPKRRKLWVFTNRPPHGGHYRWIAETPAGRYFVGEVGAGDGEEAFGPFDDFDAALATVNLTEPAHIGETR